MCRTPAAVWSSATIVVLVAGAVGCRPPEAKLVSAEGIVTIKGRPAADIMLQFVPDPQEGALRPTSFAVSDADGRFRLRTYDGKEGAVEGEHTVVLSDTLEERPAQGENATRPPRIDSKFGTVAGGIRREVSDGGDPIAVEVP